MVKISKVPSAKRRGYLRKLTAPSLFLLGGSVALAQQTPAEAPIEIPAIPAIIVPDFIGVEPSQQGFEDALGDRLADIDGIRIAPARCDANGVFVSGLGMVLQDDEGIVANLGNEGTYMVETSGAGVVNAGGVRIMVDEDGSGVIDRDATGSSEAVRVTVDADGSGTYSSGSVQITLDGEGGGTWSSATKGQVTIDPDGSGTWSGPLGQITNEGDGSGTWVGAHMIINEGNGQGMIDGAPAKMDPLPPVPPAGKFPPLGKLRTPPLACGYVITLSDQILFDFDKDTLRPDAAATVEVLAEAFTEVRPNRLEVRGHTDSKGSDDYNRDLSTRRAQTVAQALTDRNVESQMQAEGLGESQPVAANDIDGEDNPAGRQLNRRVEIFVPAN